MQQVDVILFRIIRTQWTPGSMQIERMQVVKFSLNNLSSDFRTSTKSIYNLIFSKIYILCWYKKWIQTVKILHHHHRQKCRDVRYICFSVLSKIAHWRTNIRWKTSGRGMLNMLDALRRERSLLKYYTWNG